MDKIQTHKICKECGTQKEMIHFQKFHCYSLWLVSKCRDCRNKLIADKRRKFPLKKAANAAVYNALKNGTLIRGKCEACAKKNQETKSYYRVLAHHCDYSKPLDVMWLCVACHIEWHKNNKAVYPNDNI
jgi:hypothetical protein